MRLCLKTPHVLAALRYSLDGFCTAWKDEIAFRQVVTEAAFLVPLAFLLGEGWVERTLLILPCFLCIMVELLNSAIENTVDRISLERHPLSKKAKDLGSSAQMSAQIFLAFVWLSFMLGGE